MRCLDRGCKRHRLAGYSRCESHLRALIARVFGRNAEYPVRAA